MTLYPEHWDEELKQTVRLWLKDMQTGSRPLTQRTIQGMRERFIRYSLVLKSDFQLSPLVSKPVWILKRSMRLTDTPIR